jgi:hypothetical protein
MVYVVHRSYLRTPASKRNLTKPDEVRDAIGISNSERTLAQRYNSLLTPWSRALLEKLTGLELVKKLPAFYGTRRFLTTLTSAHHLSLS